LRVIELAWESSDVLRGETVKPSVFVSLIFFFLTMGTTVGAAEVDAGKELYVQYCSSCHGEERFAPSTITECVIEGAILIEAGTRAA
jgi:hypothetical protein